MEKAMKRRGKKEDLRTWLHLSQEQLAGFLGVNRSYVAQIETHRRPPSGRVGRKLAELVKIALRIRAGMTAQQEPALSATEITGLRDILRRQEKKLQFRLRKLGNEITHMQEAIGVNEAWAKLIAAARDMDKTCKLQAGILAHKLRYSARENNGKALYLLRFRAGMLQSELERVQAALRELEGQER